MVRTYVHSVHKTQEHAVASRAEVCRGAAEGWRQHIARHARNAISRILPREWSVNEQTASPRLEFLLTAVLR